MKFFIFSKIFRPKQKMIFWKISKIWKFGKYENPEISKFWHFSEKWVCVLVENFPKNKKFQNKISYLFLLLSCPCGVKFSSPRAVSKPVFGASNKKIVLSTPKIVLFDQTGRFHELQGGERTIFGVESTIFCWSHHRLVSKLPADLKI